MGKFEKLTPANDYQLGIYEDAMNFVFDNKDILNIAVTGPYASGKSSMIKTYKEKHKKNFLHISLAHFEKNGNLKNSYAIDNNNPESKNNMEKENILEGKILNQLIHNIDPKEIPQTNFKIKRKITSKRIGAYTFIINIFLLLILYISLYNYWYITVSGLHDGILKEWLNISLNNKWLIFSGFICFVISCVIVWSLIKTNKFNNRIKKFKFQESEIEVFENKEESYFDKYLNEVLYLFENSKKDMIVFEDIDRYNSTKIFEKLREINTLVNSRSDTPIRFLYLLKDDMFDSKDRTKFFDFIIPIIPVIDSSNSYDKFIQYFESGGIYNLFDATFLSDISLYVDDMRLLKNIYNEFLIYHSRLEGGESEKEKIKLDNDKLLAIIVYKNIFPKDFSNLQLGQGFVYNIFASRENLINDELSKINKQIEILKKDNNEIKNEQLESIDELDALYVKLPHYNLRVGEKEINEFSNRADFINKIKNNEYMCKSSDGYYWRDYDLKSYFKALENNDEYKQKEGLIKSKYNNILEENIRKINKLNNKCRNIKSQYLHQIITRDNEKEVFSVKYRNEIGEETNFNEIKRSIYFPLIKYLIRNGYIDENYSDYMTYFYSNSLTYSDKNFVLSVTNRDAKDYAYKLIDCELILSKIRESDFLEEEVLNFDLFNYLLNNSEKYAVQLDNFLSIIKNQKSVDFITGFWKIEESSKSLLVKKLNSFWDNACNWIINEEKFGEHFIREYIQNTVQYSDEDNILSNNIEIKDNEKIITNYINNDDKFLNTNQISIDRLNEIFKILNVKMKSINFDESNKNLFMEVYKNRFFEIDFDNICTILDNIYKYKCKSDYILKNYTLIMSKDNEELAKYINDNMNTYIKVFVNGDPIKVFDYEEYALKIINNTDLDDTLREKYIKVLQTNIHSLERVNNKNLWGILLEKGIIDYNEKNILDYFFYSGKGLDNILITFINNFQNRIIFNSKNIREIYGENSTNNLFDKIIESNKISDDKYKEILESLKVNYNYFNIYGIVTNKVSILIKLNIIIMNLETLTFIRENYPDNLIEYIVLNIETYLKHMLSKNNFEYDEMIQLLETEIDDNDKINLIEYTDNKISIIDKNYSNKIKKYILENNFDYGDIEYLINNFNYEDDEIKEVIRILISDNIETILEKKIVIDYDKMLVILNDDKLDDETKCKLLISDINALNYEEVYECFKQLGRTEYLQIFNHQEVVDFQNTKINKLFLDALKFKEIINDYEEIVRDGNEFLAVDLESDISEK